MSNIAVLDQTVVDAQLDRIQRFVASVYAFKERMDALLNSADFAGIADQETEKAPAVSFQPEPPVDAYVNTPAATAPITADDVDLDAILDGISLDGSHQML